MDNYHITFDKEKGNWVLKKEGGARALKKADKKTEIIKLTQDYMSNKKGSVKIHINLLQLTGNYVVSKPDCTGI